MSDQSSVQASARLAIVISGRGRNLQAIIEAIEAGELNAQITLVISNRRDAPGMQIARLAGLNCVCIEPAGFNSRDDFDAAMGARIAAARPDWVVLAGYMRILGSAFVKRFESRLINIHPSLLPRYKGLNTHERALSNGDARHGASVHFVTPDLDGGPLIRQASIAIAADDTPETLADRLMEQVEQRLYPAVLAELGRGEVRLHDGVVLRQARLQEQCPHDHYDTNGTT
jgi:phosphoribosylglycinamide formyltransferase-1